MKVITETRSVLKKRGYDSIINISIEEHELEVVKKKFSLLLDDKFKDIVPSYMVRESFEFISLIVADIEEENKADYIKKAIFKVDEFTKELLDAPSKLNFEIIDSLVMEKWKFLQKSQEFKLDSKEIEEIIVNDTNLLLFLREQGYRVDKNILENKWKSFEKNTIRFDNYIKMVLNEFEVIRQPNNDKQIWPIFINFSNDLIQSIFEHEDFDLKTLVEELLDFQFKKVDPYLKGDTNFIHFKIWKKVFDKLSESPDLDNIFPKDGEFEVTDGTEEVLRKTFSGDVVAFIYSYSAISYLILFNNRLNEYFSNKLYESLREYQKKIYDNYVQYKDDYSDEKLDRIGEELHLPKDKIDRIKSVINYLKNL